MATASDIDAARLHAINDTIADLKRFRFCGPSDDPDEQTAVTLGYSHLLVQLQHRASQVLPQRINDRLRGLKVDPDELYSVFDVHSKLDAILPDIEAALTAPTKPLPVPVCVVVGDVLGTIIYHHSTLETLFYEAGAGGEIPQGNCVLKCQSWLKRMHEDVVDPIAVLGKVLEEFMEVDRPHEERQEPGRKRIIDALAKVGLSYQQGGVILGASNALPTKSLQRILIERDLVGVQKEFDRALANVDTDPPAAITAACSILESLFKIYLEDTPGLDVPADQSLKPLWRAASKHLGLDPAQVEDEDVRKILSGLNSVIDGIGSLRTHSGSAHGRGRRSYRLLGRHARLAIHASHTLVMFFLETWDERKRRVVHT